MAIYLVTGSAAAGRMRSINGFTMDLGKGIMDAERVTFYDDVVKNHASRTGRLIHMYGRMGSLLFYSDTMYEANKVSIFYNQKSYHEVVNWSEHESDKAALDAFMARAKANILDEEKKDVPAAEPEEEDIVESELDARIRRAREMIKKSKEE